MITFSDDDHICNPYLPQEKTITEVYRETYDKIYMVYDDTPPYGDKGLERFSPCNIFEMKLFEEDCYEDEEVLPHIHLQLGYLDVTCKLTSYSILSYFSHGVLAWIITASAISEPCSAEFPCQD